MYVISTLLSSNLDHLFAANAAPAPAAPGGTARISAPVVVVPDGHSPPGNHDGKT